MTLSFRNAIRGLTIGMFVILGFGARSVEAVPIASLEYLETSLGGGLFQYDYFLTNLGDPVTDAGYDAYDFTLFFSPQISLVNSLMPAGWDLIAGAGFVNAFSLLPGPSPVGTDVAPGQSLALVRFVFNGQINSTLFEVVFANPADPGNPVIYQGTTAPVTQVPEPASLLLFVAGAASLALARRRRAQSHRWRELTQ